MTKFKASGLKGNNTCAEGVTRCGILNSLRFDEDPGKMPINDYLFYYSLMDARVGLDLIRVSLLEKGIVHTGFLVAIRDEIASYLIEKMACENHVSCKVIVGYQEAKEIWGRENVLWSSQTWRTMPRELHRHKLNQVKVVTILTLRTGCLRYPWK